MGLPLPYNTFGTAIPYLVPVNDNHNESFGVFGEYNEDKALKYFKNLSSRGHGQTVWNVEKRFQGLSDSPLTELGITQAKLLGKKIKKI